MCILGVLLSFLSIFLSANSPGQPDIVSNTQTIISPSGAFCWFQDPRAIYVEGKFRRTYVGWISSQGKLEVGYYDHDTNEIGSKIIKEFLDVDDHNVSSFLVLPDLRLMIFYARHNKENLYARQTLKPEDITDWGDEIIVTRMDKVTYSHPVYLVDEKCFYVFWRGNTWKPTFATSKDGLNWSEPKVLFQDRGKEAENIRPYLKVVSDGKRTIHFTFTDGHPRNEPLNSVYYACYKEGKFKRADGTLIGSMNSLPILHSDCDKVYDATRTGARAWVWDIALDKKGEPVIVYTQLPEEDKHFYHYVLWNGKQWVDHEITFAGPWFPETPKDKKEPEPHYSAGICINHANSNEVYLSRKRDTTFEIERWVTHDAGKSWSHTPVTQNSTVINVRPIVPWGYNKEKGHILWMRGHYTHYTQFQTSIFCWVER